jgi:hypothetical protein
MAMPRLHEDDIGPGVSGGARRDARTAGWRLGSSFQSKCETRGSYVLFQRLGLRGFDQLAGLRATTLLSNGSRDSMSKNFAMSVDAQYDEDRHWVSGILGVSEWLLTGTTRDGHKVEGRRCDHYEFRNPRVVRKDSYWKIVE